jgi:hypothetical protein
LDEVLSAMLATIEADEFPSDPAPLAASLEDLASRFALFAPMATGVDPEAVGRVLNTLETKEIIARVDGKYVMTPEGRARCLSSKRTLFNQQDCEQLDEAARAFMVPAS